MKFNGRTVLITGGSNGIGLAFARRFLDLGAVVIVTGRRQEVLDEARKRLPKLHTVQSDVSDPIQVAALAAQMKAEFPRPNVLVNSAGVMLGRNLSDPTHDLVDLTREIDTNLSGVVRTTAALMDLIIANRGTILNISSALALVPAPAMPIYCATKAAVHSYTSPCVSNSRTVASK